MHAGCTECIWDLVTHTKDCCLPGKVRPCGHKRSAKELEFRTTGKVSTPNQGVMLETMIMKGILADPDFKDRFAEIKVRGIPGNKKKKKLSAAKKRRMKERTAEYKKKIKEETQEYSKRRERRQKRKRNRSVETRLRVQRKWAACTACCRMASWHSCRH